MLRLSILLKCNDSFLSTLLMFLKHNKMSCCIASVLPQNCFLYSECRGTCLTEQHVNMLEETNHNLSVALSRTTNTTAHNFNISFNSKRNYDVLKRHYYYVENERFHLGVIIVAWVSSQSYDI